MAALKKNPAFRTCATSIALSQFQIDAILEKAKREGISRSMVVRCAINEHLKLTPPPEYVITPSAKKRK